MSATDAAKRMKKMLGLGVPPTPQETRGTLQSDGEVGAGRTRGEPTVQLNLRVPPRVKHRVRVLAARDGLTHSELVMRAIDLYEQHRGGSGER